VVIVGWSDRERGVLMGSDSDGFLNVLLWESRCGWGLRLLFAIPTPQVISSFSFKLNTSTALADELGHRTCTSQHPHRI